MLLFASRNEGSGFNPTRRIAHRTNCSFFKSVRYARRFDKLLLHNIQSYSQMNTVGRKFNKQLWPFLMPILLTSLLALQGCKDGGLFSRETTIFGKITEIGGMPVDSIVLVVSAYKDLGNEKPLFTVLTDKDGNYEAVVDAPKGYGSILIGIPYPGNPAFTNVYKGYEVYKEGKKTNDCCSAKIGGKTNYDFKLYK